MQCFKAESKIKVAFWRSDRIKLLSLTAKPKYHKEIINEIIEAEKETDGFFVQLILNIILKGPLSNSLISSMNQVFSGRYVNEDKMVQYHDNLKESGLILASFGTIQSCYLAIQLANMVGRDIYPIETREKLTHAALEDTPKSDEDRWISRVVQGYFIID